MTDLQLKPNVYLTLDEVFDHLKIPAAKRDEYKNTATRLTNMATDWVEKHIQTYVMVRSAISEIRDGDGSNVIVPTMGPVRAVKELQIDYAGNFDSGSPSVISLEHISVRGFPAPDFAIKIMGTDIVVRNDGNTAIVGRLFIGSVSQSIKLVYDAGYASTKEEVPQDIAYATLLVIEYFYMLRENRELNIASKSTNGQSYSRRTVGVPQEALELLDPYIDFTLGNTNRPQRNNFSF